MHIIVGLDVQKELKPKVDPRKFINIASASNMSKPQPQFTPELSDILEAMIVNDPMDTVDDDIEMQEAFQPPNQLPNNPTPTPPPPPSPPKAKSSPSPIMTIPVISPMDTDTDIEQVSDNIDIQDYNRLFKEISNHQGGGGGPSTLFESKAFQQAQGQKETVVDVEEKKKPGKKVVAPSLQPFVFECGLTRYQY